MKRSRRDGRKHPRSGATLVEAAIALPVFLLLVFGMIDLGIAVLRRNLAAEAARVGARQAIVHGADAVQLGSWNTAAATTGIRTKIEPLMTAAGVASSDYHVTVTYLKTGGGADVNSPGSTVVVRVAIDYEHIVNYPLLDPLTVASESSMIISN